MTATYKTNGCITTKSMTEYFFGEKFVASSTEKAIQMSNDTGDKTFKFWQNGTGYLTIEIF